jgi:hypothetical protein
MTEPYHAISTITAPADDQVDEFGNWWMTAWQPHRPYATDHLADGISRMGRRQAAGKRYVQSNPTTSSGLMVVDVDHSDAALRLLSSVDNHPPANAIVETRSSGRAHGIWFLKTPVARTEMARIGPLRYAAAIDEGLRRAVGGDAGYAHLLVKNPLHSDWVVHDVHRHLWELKELEVQLGNHMPARDWQRAAARDPAGVAGLGRNCLLFTSCRRWAYREVRHHFGNPDGFAVAVQARVRLENRAFDNPLPRAEADGIARSISKWIISRSQLWRQGAEAYGSTFVEIQTARSRKAGAVRREAAASRWEEIRRLQENGLSRREMAEVLGVSEAAVGMRLLRARRA